MIYNGFVFILSGYQDSNLGPPGPKPGALAGLRYTPKNITSIIERVLFLSLPVFRLSLPNLRGERGIRTPGTVTRTAV